MAALALMVAPMLALLPVVPASAADTARQVAPARAQARDRGDAHTRRHGHDGIPGQPQSVYPEVLIEPETEHWRGNYVPDSYRLDGYDGKPRGAAICSGASGRTISTSGAGCPLGQTPESGGRSWSTRP
ncbi:hypothetical protein [Salinisphaera aquimarina]|uniref:Uncharacterized protein n=1 Tax=Salinisphaera aquimarina TaxID=2094031 RepID=A0ABV7ERC1_9GAMM